MNKNLIESLFLNEDEKFKKHVEIQDNERIIFSGKFGIGKTTFITKFFEKEKFKKKYNCFHLYPVNYSVLNNEDIFKYIKYDIIYELIEKYNYKFEDNEFNFLESVPSFVKDNLYRISTSLILLIPGMGRQLFQLSDELNKLHSRFMDFLEGDSKQNIEINQLLNSIDKKEGSLYEFNVLSELIFNGLQKLKSNNPDKKNILIIDDLDRIDPNHIFRLFNIFSAHFERSLSLKSNKFGFEKVIFVCDIENIKSIYHHIYGPKTDFKGYIDKFYSKGIYYYDNFENLTSYLVKLFNETNFVGDSELHTKYLNENRNQVSFLVFLFRNFLISNSVNLRNLLVNYRKEFGLKFLKIKLEKESRDLLDWKYPIFHLVRIVRSYFLDIESLKDALIACKESENMLQPLKGNAKFFLAEVIQGLHYLEEEMNRSVGTNNNEFIFIDKIKKREIIYSEERSYNLEINFPSFVSIRNTDEHRQIQIKAQLIFEYLIRLIEILEFKRYLQ